MTIVLLLNGEELKDWWYPNVHFGFDKHHHDQLARHIKNAQSVCASEINGIVDLTKCQWAVKIKSKEV